ncbi:MAG: Uma2 family endonuclease [Caldilinea sp.]|nr:Uma2 family endonuclease [Caldilinea sp.]MDW8439179.1 Uma2 family endonuclease [Caldilineaceae bacterium]
MARSMHRQSDPNVEPQPAWEVALLFPAQGAWSEEEYLRLDTNRLVEFSDGHIEVLPMPSDRHQSIVLFLSALFAAFARRIGGKVLFAPMRLRLWPGKIREPDLLFLINAHDPRRQEAYWSGADLVVEVVSPDDRERDLVVKRQEYAQAGIPEYWIVDPQEETIAVLKLESGGYVEHGVFSRGEIAVSAHYPDLQVSVDDALDAP